MGLLGRMWRVIKGWLLIGVEKAEDPEVILTEAQESMRREVEKAKESAVQAIAARNQLRNLLQEQMNRAAECEARARQALKLGQETNARAFLVEQANTDKTIESLKVQLAQAEEASEAVKVHIQQLEAKFRERTAQKLALSAGWKQAKIQEQVTKALSGISLDTHDEAFNRAEARMKELQAKSAARSELASGTLETATMKLETSMQQQQAEDRLQALKAEMGLLPQSTVPVEDPLARLKAEIQSEAAVPKQQTQGRNLEI